MADTVWFRNEDTTAEFEVVVGSQAYLAMHRKPGFTPIDGPTAEVAVEPEKALGELSYEELKAKAESIGLEPKGSKKDLLAAIQAKLAE